MILNSICDSIRDSNDNDGKPKTANHNSVHCVACTQYLSYSTAPCTIIVGDTKPLAKVSRTTFLHGKSFVGSSIQLKLIIEKYHPEAIVKIAKIVDGY